LREYRRQRGRETPSLARATINRQVDRPTTATDVGVDVEDVDDEEGTNKRGLSETPPMAGAERTSERAAA
jgi:hypothetical protein